MDVIDKIIVKYLISTNVPGKVFFASVLTLMKKQEDCTCPTMGVTISNGTLYLIYNKDFVNEIIETDGIDALKGVLEHEILHVVYDHITRAKKYSRKPRRWNIAADMAINQLIDPSILPKKPKKCSKCKGKGAINIKKEKDGTKSADMCPECKGMGQRGIGLLFPSTFKLPKEKSADWYYNHLPKEKEGEGPCKTCEGSGQVPDKDGKPCDECGGTGKDKDGKPCDQCGGKGKTSQCPDCKGTGQSGGGKNFDDHSSWGKIKENEQMTKETIKQVIKEAFENTKKMRGSMPAGLEEAVEEILKPPTISWKHLLRQYIGSSIKTGFKSSWKRPSRRFPLQEGVKGKTSDRTIRMLIAVDTSASISNTEYNDFMNEMKGILQIYKSKIDVVTCDCEIQEIQQLRPHSAPKIAFKGRGGTAFKPVFEYLKNHIDYDLLIYFTDGYGDQEQLEKFNKNLIWVLTSAGYNEEQFKPSCGGVIVKIRKDKDNED